MVTSEPEENGVIDSEKKTPFSEVALRHIAKEKVIWALGVKIHALAFVFVNLFLVILNITTSHEFLWSGIVVSAWLAGLGIHFSAYLIYSRGIIGGNKKGLIMNLIAEIFGIQGVIVINIITNSTIMWFIWPVSAAILASIVHAVVYMVFLKEKSALSGEKKSWMERKVDEEISKVKRKK